MNKILYALAAFLLLWLVGSGTIGLGGSHHARPTADSPWATSAPDDCSAQVIASDGYPPAGTPSLDPDKLCGAAQRAETEAACLGDWQPPDPINARQFCLEVHRRGCGDPAQDCDRIPADQTYYHHH